MEILTKEVTSRVCLGKPEKPHLITYMEAIPVPGDIVWHCPLCSILVLENASEKQLPPESQGEQSADWTLEQQIERLFTGVPLSPPSRKEIAAMLWEICSDGANWANEHNHDEDASRYNRLSALFERLSK